MCTKAITINGIEFEEGVTFSVPVYAVHYDERNYPNPNEFDPERWVSECTLCVPRYTPGYTGVHIGIHMDTRYTHWVHSMFPDIPRARYFWVEGNFGIFRKFLYRKNAFFLGFRVRVADFSLSTTLSLTNYHKILYIDFLRKKKPNETRWLSCHSVLGLEIALECALPSLKFEQPWHCSSKITDLSPRLILK